MATIVSDGRAVWKATAASNINEQQHRTTSTNDSNDQRLNGWATLWMHWPVSAVNCINYGHPAHITSRPGERDHLLQNAPFRIENAHRFWFACSSLCILRNDVHLDFIDHAERLFFWISCSQSHSFILKSNNQFAETTAFSLPVAHPFNLQLSWSNWHIACPTFGDLAVDPFGIIKLMNSNLWFESKWFSIWSSLWSCSIRQCRLA